MTRIDVSFLESYNLPALTGIIWLDSIAYAIILLMIGVAFTFACMQIAKMIIFWRFRPMWTYYRFMEEEAKDEGDISYWQIYRDERRRTDWHDKTFIGWYSRTFLK